MKNNIQFITTVLLLVSILEISAQKKSMQSASRVLFGVGVIETSDKFEGTTTYQMTGNRIGTELSGVNAIGNLILNIDATTYDTFLNLEKHIRKDGGFELSIVFEVTAKNDVTVDVKKGKSLIFLLESGRIELNTEGAFNKDFDFSDSSSKASARYPLTEEQLNEINQSDVVEFRIVLDSHQSGEAEERDNHQLHLDGKFSKKNKRVWAEFVDEFLTL